MAIAIIRFTVEAEAFMDAMDDLERVARRIVKFHGEKYRALDRRIEEFEEHGDGRPRCQWLKGSEGGIISVSAAPEVTAILRDARLLGVI